MKGIAHFAIGVAAASCFPRAVEAGADGQPLYFLLGGMFGLLPDTLDFRLFRFLYRHDIEAVMDPLDPDPDVIAHAMALAASRAVATRKPVRVKLATVRLGADEWLRYLVRFDVAKRRVTVQIGPVVTTGREPIRDRPCPKRRGVSSLPLPCDIRLEYAAETVVDIFDGPAFELVPEGDMVEVKFIPWHRAGSHGLLPATGAALLCWLCFDALAAAVAATAVVAHGVADQLGQMGNNWFYPLRGRRIPGWRATRSGDGWANVMAVWGSCLLILWNLARPLAWPHPFTFGHLLLWGLLAPLAAAYLLRRTLPRLGARR